VITYLDADLFFFADPAPLFDEIGASSIAIIGHRFPPKQRHKETRGIYNVGWISFRRDENGLSCLDWWRDRCLEWCFDRVEEGRYADQKYLDDWPVRFENVTVLQHLGANLAPWNLANYNLRYNDSNEVMVDGQQLIFFHFHGLRRIAQFLYDPSWAREGVTPSVVLRRGIYAPYIQVLQEVRGQLLSMPDSPALLASIRRRKDRKSQQASVVRGFARRIRLWFSAGRNLLRGRYLVALNGRVL
jgi:hypothetical protein